MIAKYARKVPNSMSADLKSWIKRVNREMVSPCPFSHKSPKETLEAMRNDPDCLCPKKRGDQR